VGLLLRQPRNRPQRKQQFLLLLRACPLPRHIYSSGLQHAHHNIIALFLKTLCAMFSDICEETCSVVSQQIELKFRGISTKETYIITDLYLQTEVLYIKIDTDRNNMRPNILLQNVLHFRHINEYSELLLGTGTCLFL
jgi:hypothetical protein